MKIAFLTNNESTLPLAYWLKSKGEFLVIYDGKISAEWIKTEKIDFLISYNYNYIIKDDALGACSYKAINLHISLLPWNRGADPNIWSFIENSPKGVTIHRIDAGLDTGNILLQKELFFDVNKDSFASSYNKLHFELCELFKENWISLKNDAIQSTPQYGAGTFHSRKELDPYRNLIDYNEPIRKILLSLPL